MSAKFATEAILAAILRIRDMAKTAGFDGYYMNKLNHLITITRIEGIEHGWTPHEQ